MGMKGPKPLWRAPTNSMPVGGWVLVSTDATREFQTLKCTAILLSNWSCFVDYYPHQPAVFHFQIRFSLFQWRQQPIYYCDSCWSSNLNICYTMYLLLCIIAKSPDDSFLSDTHALSTLSCVMCENFDFHYLYRNSIWLNLGNNYVKLHYALHFARKIKLMRFNLILYEFSIGTRYHRSISIYS